MSNLHQVGRPRARGASAAGFTLIELLVVVAIICIIAALAVRGLVQARIAANESSALGSLRAIHSAQTNFAASCGGGGFAQSLEDLALAPPGSPQGFISQNLAVTGQLKSGYLPEVISNPGAVEITAAALLCNGASAASVSSYFAEVHPLAVGVSGQRSFAIESSGTIYVRPDGVAITPGMGGAEALQ
jgi:prepilin-type N-terminal cleavage/methylation domain-containing protein